MVRVTRHVFAPIEDVFATVCRPETYPEWLVGTKEIRSVSADWPEPGSRFHHRVGLIGRLTIPDHSTVLDVEPPHRLVLEVKVRPFGRGRVEFRLTGEGTNDGRPVTRVVMEESPIGRLVPLQPVLEPLLRTRNVASLNALVAFLNRAA